MYIPGDCWPPPLGWPGVAILDEGENSLDIGPFCCFIDEQELWPGDIWTGVPGLLDCSLDPLLPGDRTAVGLIFDDGRPPAGELSAEHVRGDGNDKLVFVTPVPLPANGELGLQLGTETIGTLADRATVWW